MRHARLVLLVTIAALVAPFVAPCLMAAPAMPCCHHASSDTMPAASSCCATDAEQPLAPPRAVSPAAQPVQLNSALMAPGAPCVVQPRFAPEIPSLIQPSRLRNAVLLI
jgi:hypothetical protein